MSTVLSCLETVILRQELAGINLSWGGGGGGGLSGGMKCFGFVFWQGGMFMLGFLKWHIAQRFAGRLRGANHSCMTNH